MYRKQFDQAQVDRLNTLVVTLRDMIASGEQDAEFVMAMKAQIKKQIRIIHMKPIYASRKTKNVKGKEVPKYWYTPMPGDYTRKLTAPTEEALYEKLRAYYTGEGYKFSSESASVGEPENSLRKLFNRYIKEDLSLVDGSKKNRQEIWDLYLESSSIADKAIEEITNADLVNAYRDIFSAGTVRKEVFTESYFADVAACIHAVYKYAITFRGIQVNDLPKLINWRSMFQFRTNGTTSNDDIKAKALTDSQYIRAIAWCKAHKDDRCTRALWLNFHLGLRFAELFALRWRDVDTTSWCIHVRGHMNKKQERLPYTKKKTKEGMRDIPMDEEACNIFKEILAQRPADVAAEDLIFPKNGYSTYLRRCKDCYCYALELDSIEDLPENYATHSIRSTAASRMYANEMPIKLIQRILGHTNSQMTMRYCHEQSSLEDIRQQMNIALAAGM